MVHDGATLSQKAQRINTSFEGGRKPLGQHLYVHFYRFYVEVVAPGRIDVLRSLVQSLTER